MKAFIDRIMFELDFDGSGPIPIEDQIRDALVETYTAVHLAGFDAGYARAKDEAKAEVERLRAALEGFAQYCIKPECKCWACEALKQRPVQTQSGESD